MTATDPLEVLLFALDGTRFALPATDVREVLPGMTLAPLPGAPAVVLGAVQLAGEPLAVISLRRRLGFAEVAMAPEHHLVVVETGQRWPVALHVDRALGLATLAPEALGAAEALWIHARVVTGAATLADGLVLVHDPRAFLVQTEAEALESALAAATEAAR